MATIFGTGAASGRRGPAASLPLLLRAGIAAGAALLAFWALGGAGADDLPEPRRLGPDGPLAFETADATIITESRAKARWADARLREAMAGFTATFGVHPGHGVIVEMPYLAHLNALPADRKRWALPWASAYFGAGERGGAPANGHHFDNESGIAHELNHVFLTAAFFPGRGAVRYGSAAPDWLDEAVAIAAEPAPVKARRRGHFHEQVCAGRLVPLDEFLARPHPLFAAAPMQQLVAARRGAAAGSAPASGAAAGSAPASGAAMMVLPVERLGLPRTALLDFYAQSVGVAEFLAETSGDPKILARAARAFAAEPGAADVSRLDDLVGRTGRPLAARFEDWARASARAALPRCGGAERRA